MNIDFINFTNIKLRYGLSLFNLTNVINEQTRIAENSTTLIDPVLVSDACTVLDSGTLTIDNTISDHKATYVSIKIFVNTIRSYYMEVWYYKKADYNRLDN